MIVLHVMRMKILTYILATLLVCLTNISAETIKHEDFELIYEEKENGDDAVLDVQSILLRNKGESLLLYLNGESGSSVIVMPNVPYEISVREKKEFFRSILIKGKGVFLRVIIEKGKLVFTTEAELVVCDG